MARLQGTDGVRATAVPWRDLEPALQALTCQEVFSQHSILTDRFVELYVYCFCQLGGYREVVVGWDPRDPSGVFPGSAVAGVQRAGCRAVVVGIAPTPAVALHLVWRGSDAGVVISASHNFRTQNGIKLFTGPHAMKLLPPQEVDLTAAVLRTAYAEVASLPLRGEVVDEHDLAHQVFADFHLTNLPGPAPSIPLPLVVDPANGAMSGIAAQVISKAFRVPVEEVNGDTASGEVNTNGGVADLEGVTEITPEDTRFENHTAVQRLFRAKGGIGCVFDADGDRYYGLVYSSGRVLVIGGDEAAYHQARYLGLKGKKFVNTIESSLEASRAAAELGYVPVLTGVGDKWLLHHALQDPESFGIACEASGHSITPGKLRKREGEETVFFAGNGLKAALNTMTAMAGLPPAAMARPFPTGHHAAWPVYHVRKDRLKQACDGLADQIADSLRQIGRVERIELTAEPEMLYLACYTSSSQVAGLFIRNSGTEDKASVTVTGAMAFAAVLDAAGESAACSLSSAMKNTDSPYAKAELVVLRALPAKELPPLPVGVDASRVVKEMVKGKLIALSHIDRVWRRTPLADRLLTGAKL